MKTNYTNRYGDQIVLEQRGDEIVMTGYNPEWIRYSHPTKENGESDWSMIDMVDPSGGPCILIGDDLNEFYQDGTTRIVKSISINELSVIFKI